MGGKRRRRRWWRWKRGGGGGNGGETGGRERVGESSQEPSREGREWRKSVVVSHVRSSDGDVLGIATRESERRRNLANPLEFSTPESHPPILRHIQPYYRGGTSGKPPRAPPQYPRHPPSLIAKTKHMLPIYHQDILASNICRVNSSLCCIMHETCVYV